MSLASIIVSLSIYASQALATGIPWKTVVYASKQKFSSKLLNFEVI